MANPKRLIIRTTPFAFIKRLAALELTIAVITLTYRYIQINNAFPGTTLPPIPFVPTSFLNIVFISVLQIFIVVITFFTWYLERYYINSSVIFSRGEYFRRTLIPNLKDVVFTHVHQSRPGTSLNYGTLVFTLKDQQEVEIHNIPDPHRFSKNINDRLESTAPTLIKSTPLTKLLKTKESHTLEYKASFQYDYRQKKKNKSLHKAVLKNIAAFLNSAGGIIVVGVDDGGKILGLESDYSTLTKKTADCWENTFTMSLKKSIGIEFIRYISLEFESISAKKSQDPKEIVKIICQPSSKPVYLNFEGLEEFYIRTGNSSQPLTVSQTVAYIKDHFDNAEN